MPVVGKPSKETSQIQPFSRESGRAGPPLNGRTLYACGAYAKSCCGQLRSVGRDPQGGFTVQSDLQWFRSGPRRRAVKDRHTTFHAAQKHQGFAIRSKLRAGHFTRQKKRWLPARGIHAPEIGHPLRWSSRGACRPGVQSASLAKGAADRSKVSGTGDLEESKMDFVQGCAPRR